MKFSLVFLAIQTAFAAEDWHWRYHRPCKSTATVTAGKTTSKFITTLKQTTTVVKTVTKKGATVRSTATTTITTPTHLKCLATATTFTASPLPITTAKHHQDGTTSKQANARERRNGQENIADIPDDPSDFGHHTHTRLHLHTKCSSTSTVTVYQPLLPGRPCTRVVPNTATATITKTEIVTHTSISTVSEGATTTTVTQTFVMPSPSTLAGVNYYQYINHYFYNDSSHPGGSSTAGFGGGGYETSNWRGNFSYYSSGLTQNINFESENYPSYDTIYCQLPGQANATYCGYWTVVFQGFLYANQAGNYTVTFSQPLDNEIVAWGGEKAYRDYTNHNCDWFLGMSNPLNKPAAFAYVLKSGEFLPMTFIWSNGEGPGANNILITAPDGTSYPSNLNFFVPPCPHSPFVP